jgi:transmembrane sensor
MVSLTSKWHSMKLQERIDQLFTRVVSGHSTPAEWNELLDLLGGVSEHDEVTLMEPLQTLWGHAGSKEGPASLSEADKEQLYQAITQQPPVMPIEVPVQRNRFAWKKYAVAAAVAGLIFAGYKWMATNNTNTKVKHTVAGLRLDSISAGTNRATVTLGDGQRVTLDDDTATTNIQQQGDAQITNTNGRLAYQSATTRATGVVYNTVNTARANHYQVVLSDGTKVWLNAVSSLRFPTVFTENQRTVEVTGEAYFEVAKHKTKPFYVKVGGTQIQVLGTAFNVNSYSDEELIKTSLVEGSVKLISNGQEGVLHPGQEAIVRKDHPLRIAPGNIELATAWKNGYFQFDQASLPQLMRQLSRWYDVDIRYEGNIPEKSFKGKLQRSLPLSRILHLFEKGGMKFRSEGKTLVVLEQ